MAQLNIDYATPAQYLVILRVCSHEYAVRVGVALCTDLV